MVCIAFSCRAAGRSACGCGPARERGAAALEFALLLPLLSLVFVGTLDAARLMAEAYRAQTLAADAARAAARQPSIPAPLRRDSSSSSALPALSSSAALPAIAVDELVALPSGAQATGALFWGCANAKQRLEVAGVDGCPDGSRAAGYVRVDLAVPVRYVLAWPDLVLPPVARVSAVARVG
jgi:Flp pilus assembly protein TadG